MAGFIYRDFTPACHSYRLARSIVDHRRFRAGVILLHRPPALLFPDASVPLRCRSRGNVNEEVTNCATHEIRQARLYRTMRGRPARINAFVLPVMNSRTIDRANKSVAKTLSRSIGRALLSSELFRARELELRRSTRDPAATWEFGGSTLSSESGKSDHKC